MMPCYAGFHAGFSLTSLGRKSVKVHGINELHELLVEVLPTEILKIHLRDERLGEDVDLTALGVKTEYFSGSDLKRSYSVGFEHWSTAVLNISLQTSRLVHSSSS